MNSDEIKTYSYFAYLGPFWIVGMMSEGKYNRSLRFHLNQGIALFAFELIAAFAVWLLDRAIDMPLVIAALGSVCAVTSICLSVRGMLNVMRGRKKQLPLVGWLNLLHLRR